MKENLQCNKLNNSGSRKNLQNQEFVPTDTDILVGNFTNENNISNINESHLRSSTPATNDSPKTNEIRKNGRRFVQSIQLPNENKPPLLQTLIQPVNNNNNNNNSNTKNIGNENPSTLRLVLSTRKQAWQEMLKQNLNKRQFEAIELSFSDIPIESYDKLILTSQSKCLKRLSLSFKGNRFISDESLVFLNNIRLPQLEQVEINLQHTRCSRIGANYLLFDFSYVPNVRIIHNPIFDQPESSQYILYEKSKLFIELDFSKEKTINKSDIHSFHESIRKSNHDYIRLNLAGIPFGNLDGNLTPEKLQLIAQGLQSTKHISIVLTKCNLSLKQLKILTDALTENNHLSTHKTNNFIESLTLDIRENLQNIDKTFVNTFTRFTQLQSIKFIVDPEKQVKQKYEGESAFCLGEGLIECAQLNSIEIAVSETQSIFNLNKAKESLSIEAQNCSVSGYKLVDISKCLRQYNSIKHLSLNLANNWKLSYKNLKKLFENIPYFNQLQSLVLDIRSIFIYEIEFITLYFSVLRVPNLRITHDFKEAKLIEFSQNNTEITLSFKGPFTRSKICSMQDMDEFCLALESNNLTEITSISITFFFNYSLRGDSLLRLCATLGHFTRLEKLNLNFNSCFLQFEDIVFFCNGLQEMPSPIKDLKLSFTNNENVNSNSLFRIARILNHFTQLQKLHVICETEELILGLDQFPTLATIFDSFNGKLNHADAEAPNPIIKVTPQVYQVLSHDIDKTQHIDRKLHFKSHQNEFLRQNKHVSLNPVLSEAEEMKEIESNSSLANDKNEQEQTEEQQQQSSETLAVAAVVSEPQKRIRILKTTSQNLITLYFNGEVQCSKNELTKLGLQLVLDDNVHKLITVPPQPEIDNIFTDLKRIQLASLFFKKTIAKYMLFDPNQIFCDLYFA